MSKQYDSEGFMSTPLEGSGARPKDSYHPDSEDNEVRFREADEEYQRLKADFARIARARRLNSHSRSDSSRSSSPLGRQPQKRATNLPKFRIATFYASDVELWFNQIETQFALHQIDDDDERYSLTCAALSGEIASDVRDVLLQPFRSNKYESLKAILIERRGLTTPERVNKVISGEKIGNDIPSRFLRRLQKTVGKRSYDRYPLPSEPIWRLNPTVPPSKVWPFWLTGHWQQKRTSKRVSRGSQRSKSTRPAN